MTAELIRLPLAFYDDHEARDLDTPAAVKRTKSHVWIDADDPAVPELLNDAEFYAEEYKYMEPHMFGIGRSAAATAKILGAIPGVKDRPIRETC